MTRPRDSARRYLVSFRARDLPAESVPAIVIGGGVAGLTAAIHLSESTDVAVLCKGPLEESNTAHAQGGVAAVMDEAEDSFDSHVKDTLRAGVGVCDEHAVRAVVEEGPGCLRELIDWGANFDHQGSALAHTLEGGHSHRRVLHAGGDTTGSEITRALVARARSSPRIRFIEGAFVIDLVTDEESSAVRGVLYADAGGARRMLAAPRVLCATGGAGHLYRETTNPRGASGDGHALCLRAGAVMRDMEFMQFHPTTLYVAGASRMLVSEAVRGEGAYLINRRGERFMTGAHPDAELAPRDVVSLAIARELAASGDTCVFLDLRHLPRTLVEKRFPSIKRECAAYRIDLAREPVPVRPSAHYMIGGVKTDLRGRTSVPGLLAAGEVASTGLHGANRLASNSLLEGMVFGRRCAREILENPGHMEPVPRDLGSNDARRPYAHINVEDMASSLRTVMWQRVGMQREHSLLDRALQDMDFWGGYLLTQEENTPAGWMLQNMLATSRCMAECALFRKESRGVHFRADYPTRDDRRWRGHVEARAGEPPEFHPVAVK